MKGRRPSRALGMRIVSFILCLMLTLGCLGLTSAFAETLTPATGFEITTAQKYAGTASLAHDGDESKQVISTVNVSAGSYVYSAYIKAESGASATLEANDQTTAATADGNWNKVMGLVTLDAAGAVEVSVTAAGKVYIDEVALTPVNISYNDLVLNGDFEEDQLGWAYGAFCFFELENPYGGTGNSLGCPGGGTYVSTQTVTVEPNTWYMYYTDAKRDTAGSWTYIDLDPTWHNLDSSVRLAKVGEWEHLVGFWNSGANTSANIRIVRDTCYDNPAAPYTDDGKAYFDNVGMCAVELGDNLLGSVSDLSGWTKDGGFETLEKGKLTAMSLKSTYTTKDQGTAKSYANGGEYIEVEPYTDYIVSGWQYSYGAALTNLPTLNVEGADGTALMTVSSKTYNHDSFEASNNFNYWSHMSRIWNSGANTKVKVFVAAEPQADSVNSVLFGDISMQKVTKASGAINYIENGGFEENAPVQYAQVDGAAISDSGAWKVGVKFSEPVDIKSNTIFSVAGQSEVTKMTATNPVTGDDKATYSDTWDIYFRMPTGVYEIPAGAEFTIKGSNASQIIPKGSIKTISGNLVKAVDLIGNTYGIKLELMDETPAIAVGEDLSAKIVDGKSYNFMNCDTGRFISYSKRVDEFVAVKLEGENRYALKDASSGKYLDLSGNVAKLVAEPYAMRIVAGSNGRYYIANDDLTKSLIDTDGGKTAYAALAWTGGTGVIENNWYITESGMTRPMKIMLLGDSITDGDSVMNGVTYTGNNRTGYRTILSGKLNEAGDRYVFVGSKKYMQTYEGDLTLHRHEGHSGWLAWDDIHNPNHPGLNDYIDDWMVKYNPDTVCVQIGTNDCGIRSGNADYKYYVKEQIIPNWKRFIQQVWGCMNKTKGTLVISNLTPIHPKMGSVYFKSYIEYFNELMPEAVDELKGIGLNIVDAYNYEALNGLEGGYLTGISEDLIHPNTKGYAAMADSYYAALRGHWSKIGYPTAVTSVEIAGEDTIGLTKTGKFTAQSAPADATPVEYTWSVVNGTGEATIDKDGVLTPVAAGTVTVKVTAAFNGTTATAEKEITIIDDRPVPVSAIEIADVNITVGETKQLTVKVLPETAAQTAKWEVYALTGDATITEGGILTATKAGVVVVRAAATEDESVYAYKAIEITKPISISTLKVKLAATLYTYDGKVKKPAVTVTDANGKKIASSNYTVTYASGRKLPGTYTVKVTMKGSYTGTKTLTFAIRGKQMTVSKLTALSKGFKATWAKQSYVTGYQVQYSTSSKFTASTTKTATISKYTITSKTVTKLKAKTKYYVRVRSYKTTKISGKNYNVYSAWSKAKTVTTKK